MVELGDIAKDSVSGYKGVVVAVTHWLNGCRRITIQSQELHNGQPIDGHTFDEMQVEVVKAKSHKAKTSTGGPRPEPTQAKSVR